MLRITKHTTTQHKTATAVRPQQGHDAEQGRMEGRTKSPLQSCRKRKGADPGKGRRRADDGSERGHKPGGRKNGDRGGVGDRHLKRNPDLGITSERIEKESGREQNRKPSTVFSTTTESFQDRLVQGDSQDTR